MQKINGPREFFQELNTLLRSINLETASPQTKDALAKVCSYVNAREMEAPRRISSLGNGAVYTVTERERVDVCEAADILRGIYRGHLVGKHDGAVLEAYRRLHLINYVASPTWNDGEAS